MYVHSWYFTAVNSFNVDSSGGINVWIWSHYFVIKCHVLRKGQPKPNGCRWLDRVVVNSRVVFVIVQLFGSMPGSRCLCANGSLMFWLISCTASWKPSAIMVLRILLLIVASVAEDDEACIANSVLTTQICWRYVECQMQFQLIVSARYARVWLWLFGCPGCQANNSCQLLQTGLGLSQTRRERRKWNVTVENGVCQPLSSVTQDWLANIS